MKFADTSYRFSAHLKLAHSYWTDHLKPNDCVIDATCGNGHDTLVLADLLNGGKLFAIDIQECAIQSAKNLLNSSLSKEKLSNVSFRRMCHAQIDTLDLADSPRLIVYNLGYLPKGNKTITTTMQFTLESLSKAVSLLTSGGAISLTCYPGHPEGEREEKAIAAWASSLPDDEWLVAQYRWLNRPRSPVFLWIQKI